MSISRAKGLSNTEQADEWMNCKDFEGIGHGLVKVLTTVFFGQTAKIHETPSLYKYSVATYSLPELSEFKATTVSFVFSISPPPFSTNLQRTHQQLTRVPLRVLVSLSADRCLT